MPYALPAGNAEGQAALTRITVNKRFDPIRIIRIWTPYAFGPHTHLDPIRIRGDPMRGLRIRIIPISARSLFAGESASRINENCGGTTSVEVFFRGSEYKVRLDANTLQESRGVK